MLRKDPFITGEYYHIYNRGIDKKDIVKSSFDYQRFTMLLYIANSTDAIRLDNVLNNSHKTYEEVFAIERGEPLVSIGAWCLMTNHFHILVKQEVDGGITKFMKKFGTGYSMYFNIKYQRSGGLFCKPFKSKYIYEDLHLEHLFAYIHLNPLDIKFSGWDKILTTANIQKEAWKDFLISYKHSSYLDYIGATRSESSILNKSAFPEYFGITNSFEDFIDKYLVEGY
jgi:REP element-mobilizing transposase RayT